jgi:hypothetical protein
MGWPVFLKRHYRLVFVKLKLLKRLKEGTMIEIISVTDKGDALEVVYKIKGSADERTVTIRKERAGALRPAIDREIIEAIKDLLDKVQ